MALSGTGWSLLGLLVFELVALVPSFTVVLTVGRRTPSVAMNPISAGNVRIAPVAGDKAP